MLRFYQAYQPALNFSDAQYYAVENVCSHDFDALSGDKVYLHIITCPRMALALI